MGYPKKHRGRRKIGSRRRRRVAAAAGRYSAEVWVMENFLPPNNK